MKRRFSVGNLQQDGEDDHNAIDNHTEPIKYERKHSTSGGEFSLAEVSTE
jgi:hypothetical protein